MALVGRRDRRGPASRRADPALDRLLHLLLVSRDGARELRGQIAEILNRDFLPIKVDREQRFDVDDIYMTACQVYEMTEGRAWADGRSTPSLIEHLEPFVVGTYYPPEPMPGRPSFAGMLDSIATAWRDQRPALEAGRIAEIVRDQLRAGQDRRPLEDLGDAAVVGLLDITIRRAVSVGR